MDPNTLEPQRKPAPTGHRPAFAWLVLAAAILMQLCLGATYSWSQFATPLKDLFGVELDAVQTPYTVFYIVFPITLVFAGELLHRIGPRKCALLGAVFFPMGWILAGLFGESRIVLIVSIGGVSGLGAGLAYLVPIATCVRWFPKYKGLVTGLAVAGFGGSAAIVAFVGSWLIDGMGMHVLRVFLIFGIGFAVVTFASALILRYPPDTVVAAHNPACSRRTVLRGFSFWILFLGMTVGLAGGFLVNANIRQLLPELESAFPKKMAMAVSLFAIFNAAGRIVWGTLHDNLNPRGAVVGNLLFQAAVVGTAMWWLDSTPTLYVLAVLTGFNYGGVLVLYASEVGRIWGPDCLGRVYGWLGFCNVLASPTPKIASWYFEETGRWTPSFYVVGAALVTAAALLVFFLPKRGAGEALDVTVAID